MNRYIKIFIGAIFLTAIVAGYLGLTQGRARTLSQPDLQQTNGTTRTVQVTGSGELQVEPDTARIRLGVQTEAETAQAALNQNSTKMRKLIDTLEEADIPSDDIQTQTVRLSPRYNFNDSNNSRTLDGFTASNIVEVRTQNLEDIGTLLDQSVKAGANTIENISFEVSNSETLTDQVRETAVQNARHKAEELANLTDATLGPVLEIQETSNTPVPVNQQAEAPVQQAAAVPISPGSQSVRVNVQITWTLNTGNQ
ncbi:MAG: SIMPL domain-containing protein [Anaerolineales bacterium]